MPLVTTLPTWVALNAADDRSPTGFVDKRTKLPTMAGGLNLGDYFDLTEEEANRASFLDNGLLHAGRYRRIQVDPNANPNQIDVGYMGLIPVSQLPPGGGRDALNVITTASTTTAVFPMGQALSRVAVFLNKITPGNYGFIQELGIATIRWGTSSGSSGIGSGVYMGTFGTTTTGGSGMIGAVLETPQPANSLVLVLLNLPVVQG